MSESNINAAAGLPAPAAGMMPHRRPVRLVETLLAVNARGGRAEARIPGNPIFTAQNGRLDPSAHLELIAQTFAAVKGWRERHRNVPPQTGYLVGASGLALNGTAGIGDLLTITMEDDEPYGPFVSVMGRVHLRDRCLARGRLKLWLEPPGRTPEALPRREAATPGVPTMPLDQAIGTAALHPLERESDRSITQSFLFPEEFGAFQGHFPGNPLLPAFAQVRIVAYMLTSALGTRLMLTGLGKARFREPLRPGQRVKVRCRLEEAPDACRASATLGHGDRPLSSLQITARQTATTPFG